MDNVGTYVPTYTAEVHKAEAPFHGWKFYGRGPQEIFATNRHKGSFTVETTFISPKERRLTSKRVEVDLDNFKEDNWYPVRLMARFVTVPGPSEIQTFQ